MQYNGEDDVPLAGLAQVATTIVSSDAERRKVPLTGEKTPRNQGDLQRKRPPAVNRGQLPAKRARSGKTTVVWYRGHDLRVADHPALSAAVRRGKSVVPVFIWAPQEWSPGETGRWWLRQSLEQLEKALKEMGLTLIFRYDNTTNLTALREFIAEVNADAVYWHRDYTAARVELEESLRKDLIQHGCDAQSMKSELLVEPWELDTRFNVLHEYMKAWMNLPPPPMPVPTPKITSVNVSSENIMSIPLDELGIQFPKKRDAELQEVWTPGSATALLKLAEFLDGSFLAFGEGRCRRDLYGTSRLSSYLQYGELSPRQVYHAIRRKMGKYNGSSNQQEIDRLVAASRAFLKNLCSREFAHHLLFYNPTAVSVPLVPQYSMFPWSQETSLITQWQNGQTGYPLVDAAMRELRKTGWVHNILRFLLASFLTKYLLLPWHIGVRSFHEMLVDGDLTSNVLGWQWACGCNSDSLPISSLINPVCLAKKQDPTGFYVRKWVPELAKLPDKYIHCPWKASAAVLREAGVVLGVNFPTPIIDSSYARHRAREAVLVMKRILHSQYPSRWPLIQSSEVNSDRGNDTQRTLDKADGGRVISKLWALRPTDRSELLMERLPTKPPLLITAGGALSVLKAAEVRNDVSGLTPSQSLARTTLGHSTLTDDTSAQDPLSRKGVEHMDLTERKEIVRRIAEDISHEFHSFAAHICKACELTDSTDRFTSKDYIRLCTLRDQYHRSSNLTDEKQKITIYKMKNFFGKVLKLEVTGEWDRHNHGGVRGPYVYGIRCTGSSNSSTS